MGRLPRNMNIFKRIIKWLYRKYVYDPPEPNWGKFDRVVENSLDRAYKNGVTISSGDLTAHQDEEGNIVKFSVEDNDNK